MPNSPRARVFGSVMAPPRRLYVVYIPLLLMLVGVVTWTIPTDGMLAFSSLVGGLAGFGMFFDWVFRGATRFSTTLGFGLLSGYAGGAFNTWATTSRVGLTLGRFMGYDDAVLARCMAAVLISSAVLIAWGELFEKPIFGRDFKFRLSPRMNTMVVLGTFAVVVAFKIGALSYMGASSEGGHVSIVASVAEWVFPELVCVSVTAAVLTPHRGVKKWLFRLCSLALLVMLAVTGRRMMVYTCGLTLFMLRTAGLRLSGDIRRQILIFGGAGVLIVTSSLGFMLLRIAGYNQGKTTVSLQQRVSVAWSWIQNGTAFERTLSSSQSNVETRTFVIGFLADILHGSELHTPGLGMDASGLLQQVIPGALDPGKYNYPSEEALADQLYGLTYWDASNSVMTAGAVDFGLLGMILYPILLAWSMRFLVEIASSYLHQTAALFYTLGCLFLCMGSENVLTAFAVAAVHGAAYSLLIEVFFRIPRFQFLNPVSAGGFNGGYRNV